MKRILGNLLGHTLGLCLLMTGNHMTILAQTQQNTSSRPKRIFTNEDLEKYEGKYGRDFSSGELPGNANLASGKQRVDPDQADKSVTGKNQNPANSQSRSTLATRLKENSDILAKAKQDEAKLGNSLSKYALKLAGANNDFQKKTAQEQVDGVQKNLTRVQEERKKAENDRGKLLEEAKKLGLKEEDLIPPESGGPQKP